MPASVPSLLQHRLRKNAFNQANRQELESTLKTYLCLERSAKTRALPQLFKGRTEGAVGAKHK